MHKGSCLCGAVTYEIAGDLAVMGHCHCRMCQQSHGTAFATYVNVRWAQFTLLSGQADLTTYRSSASASRTFCRVCGANIQFFRQHEPRFGLAVGTLDTDPGVEPGYQIWTSSKAPWWALQDGLQSHEAQPGTREGYTDDGIGAERS